MDYNITQHLYNSFYSPKSTIATISQILWELPNRPHLIVRGRVCSTEKNTEGTKMAVFRGLSSVIEYGTSRFFRPALSVTTLNPVSRLQGNFITISNCLLNR